MMEAAAASNAGRRGRGKGAKSGGRQRRQRGRSPRGGQKHFGDVPRGPAAEGDTNRNKMEGALAPPPLPPPARPVLSRAYPRGGTRHCACTMRTCYNAGRWQNACNPLGSPIRSHHFSLRAQAPLQEPPGRPDDLWCFTGSPGATATGRAGRQGHQDGRTLRQEATRGFQEYSRRRNKCPNTAPRAKTNIRNPKKRANQMQPLICQLLPHIKLSGRIGPGWIAGRAGKAQKAKLLWKSPPQTQRGGQRQTRRGPRTAPEGPRTARENFNDAETGAQEVPTRPPTPARLPRKASDSLRKCTKRPDMTFAFSLQNSSFPCSGEYPCPYPLPRGGEGGGQRCQRALFVQDGSKRVPESLSWRPRWPQIPEDG